MKFISFLSVEERGIMGTSGALAIPFSPLPVEEKAIMGTWECACDSFSPCLSRKRQSWEYGHALAIPFSPCLSRKRQSWGACNSLFPQPVEEKGSIGPTRARQRPRMTPPSTPSPLIAFFPWMSGKSPTQISGGSQADPHPPLGSCFERFQAAI